MRNKSSFGDDFLQRSKQNHPKKRHTGILILGAIVVMIAIVFSWIHLHQRNDFSAKDPNSNKVVQVKVQPGSNANQIGQQLEKNGIIKHTNAFVYYVKKNDIVNLNSGYFTLSPKMSIKRITSVLQTPGAKEINNGLQKGFVLMREGENAAQFAKNIAQQTRFSEQAWLATLNDKNYLTKLAKLYPELLESALNAPTRYKLEGYLYPATYDIRDAKKPEDITTKMVAKMNQEMQPYYGQIKTQQRTVQEVITLASLVEREASGLADREKIAGVFLNRIDANMSLGSDVAVKYALNTDKTNLSIADTRVDSPYNLYVHRGIGPGPFNNPSIQAIRAVLNPTQRDKKYYYFIANLKTGKVYFSHNMTEHNALNANLVKGNNNTK